MLPLHTRYAVQPMDPVDLPQATAAGHRRVGSSSVSPLQNRSSSSQGHTPAEQASLRPHDTPIRQTRLPPDALDRLAGGFSVKLPDDFGFNFTPGTQLHVSGTIQALPDKLMRLSLIFDVRRPQATEEADASQALTQTVKPLRLLEDLQRAEQEQEDYETSLALERLTDDVVKRRLDMLPGVFNPQTLMRDCFNWTNRQMWDRLFASTLPVYMPSGQRSEKTRIWNALSADERARRLKLWKKRRESNKARLQAGSQVIYHVIQAINNNLYEGLTYRVEEMNTSDALVPSRVDEPWLTKQTRWFRTMPRDLEPHAARILARDQASARGKAALARSAGDNQDPLDPLLDGAL